VFTEVEMNMLNRSTILNTAVVFAGGLAAYMIITLTDDMSVHSRHITMDTRASNEATDIDSRVQVCFDEKTRKEFTNEVTEAWKNSTLNLDHSTVSIQKRWEMDGRWKKALEERC